MLEGMERNKNKFLAVVSNAKPERFSQVAE
jgi:hypothetical protein